MDYEKKYKDALEIARKLNSGEGVEAPSSWTVCEVIFPELKESEDERIRKWLIGYFQRNKIAENIKTHDIIAWLEKQGKHKPQGKSALEAIKEEKVDNANKVEPKFKIGDWIIYDRHISKVKDIDLEGYLVEDIYGDEGVLPKEFAEKHYHLWTIEDAMDGDVLHSPSYHLIWIYKDEEHYHACVNMNYVTENVATDGFISFPNDTCPANRVQRSILFLKKLKKE